jgi:heme/copper-type cytochrome/quinol oxidase subunit 2
MAGCLPTATGRPPRYRSAINLEGCSMTKGQVFGAGLIGILFAAPGFPASANAEEPATIEVTLKNHQFSPAEIHVPTGKPVILRITNQDDTVEEFDSTALQVEKVIVGGHYALVRLRPLGPGRFPFMGEYHSETAKGVVISE